MAENLVFKVIDSPAETNMTGHTKTFSMAGGSIGRSDSNNWVLPDIERIVSSMHAQIVFQESNYFLLDQSTNGTFLNGSEKAIGKGQQIQLNDGDVISMGHYQLKAVLKVKRKDLPEGLDSVDFLDTSDKTTIGSMADIPATPAQESPAFDEWLDTPKSSETQHNVWGAIDPSMGSSEVQSQSLDPLASSTPAADDFFGISSSEGTTDPLAAMSGGSSSNTDPWATADSGQSNDWWQESSQADHAPAIQQSIQTPRPAAAIADPTPSVQAQPVTMNDMSLDQLLSEPEPSIQQPVQQPIAPAATPQIPAAQDDAIFDSFLAEPAQAQLQAEPAQPQIQPEAVSLPPVSETSPTAPIPQPVQSVSPPPVQQVVAPTAQQPGTGGSSHHLANQLGIEVKTQSELDRIDQEAALLIKETSSRLMDLLRARSTVKNELRVERTMIESQDNNPLKFSATVEDALNMMFGRNSNAFMSPSAAIKDSFDNISDHQIAVLVGMRTAYDAMLTQFAPDKLSSLFERMNGKGLSMNRKARNWETFQKWFADLQSDPEATYNRLFGEVFAEAYEKKLAELKSVRSMQP
ncbi:type VI secretion system-associated FHA domain protein TagH [Endozoicomonas arenosclerae]|uniref:type VI secretion system-associated FHA domain protein TagH n=1 Tax=Endozoicomonas arenosclerae TaxID=1633495 RepID=UPI0007816C0C|nr:type VI secretion system-associated FHA domain protein TagH [Endozoicomonas arenosclerae]